MKRLLKLSLVAVLVLFSLVMVPLVSATDGVTYIFLLKWGSLGAGNGQFNTPWDVAVDSNGNVYVADTYNHRIQKFTSSGGFLTKWGSYGTGDGQFNVPCGVAVDSNGNVYVADSHNHRIQTFTSTGAYITKWGSQGNGNGQFSYPSGVAVDSGGNVYVADTANNRIQKLPRVIVIPEFPSFLITPLLITATLLALIIHRRKKLHPPKS